MKNLVKIIARRITKSIKTVEHDNANSSLKLSKREINEEKITRIFENDLYEKAGFKATNITSLIVQRQLARF